MVDEKNTLEEGALSKYVESNAAYYEQYREKFNQKNGFLSWNWSAFFLFFPWLAYRKLWGSFFVFWSFSLIISLINYSLISRPSADLVLSLLVVLGIALVFGILVILNVNNQILKRAKEYPNKTGRSSPLIVFLSILLIFAPAILPMHAAYSSYKKQLDYRSAYFISRGGEDDSKVFRVIGDVSEKNINDVELIDKIVCYDNIEMLDAVEKKGGLFTSEHLESALKCSSYNSVNYLVSKGVRSNEDSYRLVRHALFDNKPSVAKLLLTNEGDLSLDEDAKVLIVAAIANIENLDEQLAFIQHLINDKKVKLSDSGDYPGRALSEAVESKNLEIIELLLKNGAKPNHEYSYDSKVIDLAVRGGNVDIIELLLKYRESVSAESLENAIKSGDKELLSLMLNGNHQKYEKEDVGELFNQACWSGDTSFIDVLVEKGYDINSFPILFYSCSDAGMFSHAVSKGADANLTYEGKNILQHILSVADDELTQAEWDKFKLVFKNAFQGEYKNKILRSAFYRKREDVIEYIFENSNDIDFTLLDGSNRSLLHYAAKVPFFTKEIINRLKENNLSEQVINIQGSLGDTALHIIAKKDASMIPVFLKAGADPDIANSDGFTPLAFVSSRYGYEYLKNTGNSISKSKGECRAFVEAQGIKDFQSSCVEAAKNETYKEDISYYQLLGGDFVSLFKNLYKSSSLRIGHGYVIEKDFEKASISYKVFLNYHRSIEDSVNTFQKDMVILSRLYGETFKDDAQKVWDKAYDEVSKPE